MQKGFVFTLLLLCCSTPVAALEVRSFASRTSEFVLGNGLKLVVHEDRRAPVVINQVWYRVGSAWEPPGRTGVSHVLEHMMFKGTTHLQPGQFSELIARVGGQENAFTNTDYTGYYQQLAVEHLELALQLEAERMANLRLDEEDFARELDVVKEERRLRTDDQPPARFRERLRATAYLASAYGQPVIGWMHDLDRLTVKDIRRWYEDWYAPNNAVLVVCGDVVAKDVLVLAEKHFGGIPARDLAEPPALLEIARPGSRQLQVRMPVQLPQVSLTWNVPGFRTAPEPWESHALRMLAGVLDAGYSARIESELVRGSELALGAGASYDQFARGDSLFTLSGTPNPPTEAGLEALEAALHAQVRRLQETLADADELSRVRAQVLAGLVFSHDSLHGRANMIGSLEAMGISWRVLDEYIPAIEQVTAEQVRDVARRYLVAENLTTGRLLPESADEQEVQP